jgi:hypothetical protein
MEDKKEFEVVPGDGSNLDISPVYNNINEFKPKSTHDKPINIVIPKESKKDKKKKNKKDDKEN